LALTALLPQTDVVIHHFGSNNFFSHFIFTAKLVGSLFRSSVLCRRDTAQKLSPHRFPQSLEEQGLFFYQHHRAGPGPGLQPAHPVVGAR
ncbi:MAG TPA: hypothetical protein VGC22_13200, partial [Chitinophaga sp.]